MIAHVTGLFHRCIEQMQRLLEGGLSITETLAGWIDGDALSRIDG